MISFEPRETKFREFNIEALMALWGIVLSLSFGKHEFYSSIPWYDCQRPGSDGYDGGFGPGRSPILAVAARSSPNDTEVFATRLPPRVGFSLNRIPFDAPAIALHSSQVMANTFDG